MYIWTKVEDDCTCKVRGPFETEGDCLEDLKHYLKIETSYFNDYFSIKVRELDSLPFSGIEQAFLGTGITFQIHELTDPTPKKSMETSLKQVIIVRTHYPDKNGGTRTIRTGKLIAQAGHAVLGCFNPVLQDCEELTPVQKEWLYGDQKKICCHVKTAEQLLALRDAAVDAGVPHCLVEDKGLTEFGEPTITALAIGPAEDWKIDPITRHLPLY